METETEKEKKRSAASVSSLVYMEGNRSTGNIKKSRASRPKVKTGCKTCKLRGVKCDEEKPVCRRCISSGRICDGYGIWGGGGNTYGSKERSANLPSLRRPRNTFPLLSMSGKVSQQEMMTFDYYKTRTSMKLPGIFDSGFWESLVFQASSTEPAVLHALLALGDFHRSKSSKGNAGYLSGASHVGKYEHLALQHYNKAISHLSVHFSNRSWESMRVALITCLIFACIELLREKINTANTHINNGLKLLLELQGRDSTSASTDFLMLQTELGSVDNDLIEAFARLNIHSPLFGNSPTVLFTVVQDATSGSKYEELQFFKNLHEARLHLDGLMNGIYYLSVQVDEYFSAYQQVPEKFISRKERLQASLERWSQTFDTCLPSWTSRTDYRTPLSIPLLRIYYSMAIIMVSACTRPGDETVYDSHTQDFASIFRQTVDLWKLVLNQHNFEKSSFTADVGFIPPLYYTALKCRAPHIRRGVIQLLMSAPHREGLWDGLMSASVANHVMAIEEADFYKDTCIRGDLDPLTDTELVVANDKPPIPDFARLRKVSVALSDSNNSKSKLTYTQRCGGVGEDGSWEIKTVEIDLSFSKGYSADVSGCITDTSRLAK